MISWSKLYSTLADDVGHLMATVFQFGPKTAYQAGPFGDDSNPIQGMDAIFAETSTDDAPVILAYVNTRAMAAPGEKRFFSLKIDEEGNVSESFYTWMKNDDTYEIGGNVDNAVRYLPLNAGLQQTIEQINVQLAAISVGIAAAGGEYSPEDVSVNISGSKIDSIKTL